MWKTFFISTLSLRFTSPMTILLSVFAFFVLLSVLIFIHEYGHFFAARRAGIVVEEFGIGIPPRACKLFKNKGTVFSLNWIPFGGFVRLKGENSLDPEERKEAGSFAAASVLARIAVLVAGVFMNIVLALVLFSFVYSAGSMVPRSMSEEEFKSEVEAGLITTVPAVGIAAVAEDDLEYKEVKTGKIIKYIDGLEVTTAQEIIDYATGRDTVTLTLYNRYSDKEAETESLAVSALVNQITLVDVFIITDSSARPFTDGVKFAFRDSWYITVSTVKGLGHLMATIFKEGRVPEGISGPLGIAQLTHSSVQEGWWQYLWLMAVISLSLATLNILPVPPLDGGRLLFVVLEVFTKRQVNRKFELIVNEIGFVLLLLLIVFITFNDFFQLF